MIEVCTEGEQRCAVHFYLLSAWLILAEESCRFCRGVPWEYQDRRFSLRYNVKFAGSPVRIKGFLAHNRAPALVCDLRPDDLDV